MDAAEPRDIEVLLKRLMRSWLRDASAVIARNHEPERLAGATWLVRGRHGVFVASDNDIFVGRALIQYGEFSELEWILLQRYCAAGDAVVEVGANIGVHSVSLAKAVGPQGRLVAIEPERINFQMLCANLALNGLTNVETHRCGCGSAEGLMSLPLLDYDAEQNFGGISLQPHDVSRPSWPVPVRRLDDLLHGHNRVDLIKIDVEGMEAEVLDGAKDVIGSFKPVLYVENDRVPKSKALIEKLAAMGFRMWWHVPRLYNADNYYGQARNLYPTLASFNMLCLHRSRAQGAPDELKEIVDADWHPLAGRG